MSGMRYAYGCFLAIMSGICTAAASGNGMLGASVGVAGVLMVWCCDTICAAIREPKP